jgi:two-component system NtrC family response regulator
MLAQRLLARHRPNVNLDLNALPRYFDSSAIRLLLSHHWPGNIRELANVIEHASILANRLPISADDLPSHLGRLTAARPNIAPAGMSLREIEMQTIHATLDRLNGNKTATAQQLGISLKTLYNKLGTEPQRKAG